MALKAILEQANEDRSDFENAIYYGVVARMVLAGILLAEDARVELTSALVAQGDRYMPYAGSEDLSVLSAREYMAAQGEVVPDPNVVAPRSFFAGEEQVELIPGQFFKILDMNNPSSFDEQVATMAGIVQSARYSPLAPSLRGYVEMFAAHHERLLKQKLSEDRNARLPELNAKIRALRDQGLTPESLEALRPAAREHFGDMKPEAHAALLERTRLVGEIAKQSLRPGLEECLSEGPLLDRRYPIPTSNLEVWSGWRGNLDAQNRWDQGADLIATIPVSLDAIPKNSPDDQALAFIDEALRSKMIEVMGNPWAAPELLELLLKRFELDPREVSGQNAMRGIAGFLSDENILAALENTSFSDLMPGSNIRVELMVQQVIMTQAARARRLGNLSRAEELAETALRRLAVRLGDLVLDDPATKESLPSHKEMSSQPLEREAEAALRPSASPLWPAILAYVMIARISGSASLDTLEQRLGELDRSGVAALIEEGHLRDLEQLALLQARHALACRELQEARERLAICHELDTRLRSTGQTPRSGLVARYSQVLAYLESGL